MNNRPKQEYQCCISLRKEEERLERERKVREMYEQKLLEEAAEAKRAEKIVKALEKKVIPFFHENQYVQND